MRHTLTFTTEHGLFIMLMCRQCDVCGMLTQSLKHASTAMVNLVLGSVFLRYQTCVHVPWKSKKKLMIIMAIVMPLTIHEIVSTISSPWAISYYTLSWGK